jgi:hypothetical protein
MCPHVCAVLQRFLLNKPLVAKNVCAVLVRRVVTGDVLHPDSKQQTTPAAPRDALECVAALARTREDRQNCVRFAYL